MTPQSVLAPGRYGEMVARAKTHNLKCSACKERRATVGCRDKGCKRVFHLQCAKTNGEWHDAESAFYCKHPPRQMAEDAALALLDARAVPQLDAAE